MSFSDKPDLFHFLLNQRQYNRKELYRQGLWRAVVVRTDDDENRGRVQVRIPQLHGGDFVLESEEDPLATPPGERRPSTVGRRAVPPDLLPWAEPALPFGGSAGQGHISIPPVGATVWVGFEHGFANKPIWLGAWYGVGELPSELQDTSAGAATPLESVRLIKTTLGHFLLFDDVDGKIRLEAANQAHKLILDGGTDTVTLQKDATNKVEINPTQTRMERGNASVLLDDSGAVTITGGVSVQINGTAGTVDITAGGAVNVTAGGAVNINASGVINITSGVITINAPSLTLNTTGNVDLAAAGEVNLGTGGEKVVLGESFQTLFNGHTHPGDSGGTTGPPNQPITSSELSQNVKAKA